MRKGLFWQNDTRGRTDSSYFEFDHCDILSARNYNDYYKIVFQAVNDL